MSGVALNPKLLAAAGQIAGATGTKGKVERSDLETAGITGDHARKALAYDKDQNGLDPQELARYLSRRLGSYTIRVNGRSYRVNNGKLEPVKPRTDGRAIEPRAVRGKTASPSKIKGKPTGSPVVQDPISEGHSLLQAMAPNGRNISYALYKKWHTKWFGENGEKTVNIHSKAFKKGLAELLGIDDYDDITYQGLDAVFGNQDGGKGGDRINRTQLLKRLRFARAYFGVRRQLTGWGISGHLMSRKIVIYDRTAAYQKFESLQMLARLMQRPVSVVKKLWKKYLPAAAQTWIDMAKTPREKARRRSVYTYLQQLLERHCDKGQRFGKTIVGLLDKPMNRGLKKLIFMAYQNAFDKAIYDESVDVKISGPLGASRTEQFISGVFADFFLGLKPKLPKTFDNAAITKAAREWPPLSLAPKKTVSAVK